MTREICKVCGDINRVGFSVPDDTWRLAVPERYQDGVVCLRCFTRFADEAMLKWEEDIEFSPVSFATHAWGERTAKALEKLTRSGKRQPSVSDVSDGSEIISGEVGDIKAVINGQHSLTITANKIESRLTLRRPAVGRPGTASAKIRVDTGDKVFIGEYPDSVKVYSLVSNVWSQYDPPSTLNKVTAKLLVVSIVGMHFAIENGTIAFMPESFKREFLETYESLLGVVSGLEHYLKITLLGRTHANPCDISVRVVDRKGEESDA